MEDLIVLGAGGHARVLLDLCTAAGRQVHGLIDKDLDAGSSVAGVPVLGGDELLTDRSWAGFEFVVGVGRPDVHRRLAKQLTRLGLGAATLVHPSAVVSPRASLAPGVVVMAGAIVQPDVTVGLHAVVNTRSSIDHDCVLADWVEVGPGAVLAGGVRVEEGAIVGAGAVVLPGRCIGAGAIVGAGATVVHDVADGVTVTGPAAQRR